jgi:hypothetical protein
VYEHKHEKLLPRKHFKKRVVFHFVTAFTAMATALLIGIAGYHYFGSLPWVDSFLNAAMILGGMGPVNPLNTVSAKVFAGLYALFSGVVFIGVAGLIIAPFAHRLLHHFHVDEDQ